MLHSNDLPKSTDDLVRAKSDLDEYGYCIVADALSAAQLARLRDRLIGQARAEAELGIGTFDGGAGTPNQRLWNLINKGEVFRELILNPIVGEMMSHLLGENFILSSLTANIAGPGGERQMLHRDQGYLRFATPIPVVANIGWMLDDVTEENGGTRLIPRSHRWPEPPDCPVRSESTIAAEGRAGSVLVFDGRIFHGTGENRTRAKRHVLLSYFARFFMRQQENVFMSLDQRVEAALSDAMKIRLGYQVRGTLGGVQGSREGAITSRPGSTIGELRPNPALSAQRERRDRG